MKERPDEKIGRERLEGYFLHRLNLGIRLIPNKDDPPDYHFCLSQEKFAVEVTAVEAKFDTVSGPKTSRDFKAFRQKIIRNIDTKARQQAFLRGCYWIYLIGKCVNFRKDGDNFEQRALFYIKRTRNKPQAAPEIIYVTDHGKFTIRKMSFSPDKILDVASSGAWTETPEFKAMVCRTVQDALSNKKEKLEAENLPIILVLVDRIDPAERTHYKRCLGNLQWADFFHSIFVAESSNRGYFLCSRREDWIFG